MDVVLGTDDAVAAKDRLYRALDKALEHKEALESHLAQRWRDCSVPSAISASPARLPNFWPCNDRVRPAREGAATSRNRSNFFQEESEGHHSNSRAHQGEKCAFVRRMVTKFSDHVV